MFKKWISILCLMGGVVGAGLAQDATREAEPIMRSINTVSSVELVQAGDSYELVVKGDLADGCDYPTIVNTEHVGRTWFIDLYRELPFGVMCPAVMKSYEEHIDASPLFEEEPVAVIVVNGSIYGVENTAEPTGEATQEPVAPVLTQPWVHSPLPYDHIAITHTEQGDVSITLSGNLTDGCAIPVYRAVPDWQNEGFTNVEAYTAINLMASCLQETVPFEATMTTTPFQSLAINGVSVPFDPAMSKATQEFVEQALPITSATYEWVEGFQPNLKITVTGTIDGCDAPIQMVPQRPVDNSYLIKVVRVLPADTVCTEIAREFTQELMFTPQNFDMPLMLFIGDQTLMIEMP
jgi:hypothetical protein